MNKNNKSSASQPASPVICPNCNQKTILIWVHGHFQCQVCKSVVVSCCDGGEIEITDTSAPVLKEK